MVCTIAQMQADILLLEVTENLPSILRGMCMELPNFSFTNLRIFDPQGCISNLSTPHRVLDPTCKVVPLSRVPHVIPIRMALYPPKSPLKGARKARCTAVRVRPSTRRQLVHSLRSSAIKELKLNYHNMDIYISAILWYLNYAN